MYINKQVKYNYMKTINKNNFWISRLLSFLVLYDYLSHWINSSHKGGLLLPFYEHFCWNITQYFKKTIHKMVDITLMLLMINPFKVLIQRFHFRPLESNLRILLKPWKKIVKIFTPGLKFVKGFPNNFQERNFGMFAPIVASIT